MSINVVEGNLGALYWMEVARDSAIPRQDLQDRLALYGLSDLMPRARGMADALRKAIDELTSTSGGFGHVLLPSGRVGSLQVVAVPRGKNPSGKPEDFQVWRIFWRLADGTNGSKNVDHNLIGTLRLRDTAQEPDLSFEWFDPAWEIPETSYPESWSVPSSLAPDTIPGVRDRIRAIGDRASWYRDNVDVRKVRDLTGLAIGRVKSLRVKAGVAFVRPDGAEYLGRVDLALNGTEEERREGFRLFVSGGMQYSSYTMADSPGNRSSLGRDISLTFREALAGITARLQKYSEEGMEAGMTGRALRPLPKSELATMVATLKQVRKTLSEYGDDLATLVAPGNLATIEATVETLLEDAAQGKGRAIPPPPTTPAGPGTGIPSRALSLDD